MKWWHLKLIVNYIKFLFSNLTIVHSIQIYMYVYIYIYIYTHAHSTPYAKVHKVNPFAYCMFMQKICGSHVIHHTPT